MKSRSDSGSSRNHWKFSDSKFHHHCFQVFSRSDNVCHRPSSFPPHTMSLLLVLNLHLYSNVISKNAQPDCFWHSQVGHTLATCNLFVFLTWFHDKSTLLLCTDALSVAAVIHILYECLILSKTHLTNWLAPHLIIVKGFSRLSWNAAVLQLHWTGLGFFFLGLPSNRSEIDKNRHNHKAGKN